MFQSSPGAEGGCDAATPGDRLDALPFQSSPGAEGGCDLDLPAFPPVTRFQSSPGAEGGCDRLLGSAEVDNSGFNPHPALKAGCERRVSCDVLTSSSRLGFNPHPALKAGATPGTRHASIGGSFQSSPGGEGGCDSCSGAIRRPCSFQSSPGAEAGCDTASLGRLSPACRVSILTRR